MRIKTIQKLIINCEHTNKQWLIVADKKKIENRKHHSFISSVGGVKVSIVAFQAIDPGSIPGWRTFSSFFHLFFSLDAR